MGYRVLAIGLVVIPEQIMASSHMNIDSGEGKKELCLGVGAEKWLDFKESADLIVDVKAATDGLGPHAALITVGDVSLVLYRFMTRC